MFWLLFFYGVLAFAVSLVYYAASGLVRLWTRRLDDPRIDDLIARNAARPRPEMTAVDWRKADRAGQRRWQEVLRGQRRQSGPRESEVMTFRRR